jgi:D-alanyl-D-alanine carboxypeptidase
MTHDLVHRVGSIAKPFLVVALMRLVEAGRVGLDDGIGEHLPDLVPGERGRAVTVRMLASHTSGIAEYLPVVYESLRAFPDLRRTSPRSIEQHRLTRFDRRELIAAGIGAPAPSAPGARPGMYSNTNYLLLAELIERLTSVAVEEHIHAEVIDRAGLADTWFPTDAQLSVPHVSLYESWFGMCEPPLETGVFDMSWVGPAASLVSTTSDLQRFFEALLHGELVGPVSLEQMQRTGPVITFEGSTVEYGLGLHRRRAADGAELWGHDGSVWGGGAVSFACAATRRAATVLVNRQRWNSLGADGRPVPHPIDRELARLDELLWTDTGSPSGEPSAL